KRARESAAKPGEMRAPVFLRNVVRVAIHRLLIGVVPLHGELDCYCVVLRAKPKDQLVNGGLGAVQISYEFPNASFELKHLALVIRFIHELDAHTGVEEGKLT